MMLEPRVTPAPYFFAFRFDLLKTRDFLWSLIQMSKKRALEEKEAEAELPSRKTKAKPKSSAKKPKTKR